MAGNQTATASPGTVLAALRAAVGERHDAERLVDHLVVEARRAGWSWADIGAALGVTDSSARLKYVRTTG